MIDIREAGVSDQDEPLPSILEVREPAEAGELAADLATLAAEINESHHRAASSTLDGQEGARRSRELLLRAKARQGHGRFLL